MLERRAEILAGARRAFTAHGYERATVALIEQETGLSRGAIFNHFASKWAIFYALAQEDVRRAEEQWLQEDFEGMLRWAVTRDPGWIGVYLEVMRLLRTSDELRRQWSERGPEVEVAIRERMQERQRAGEVRDDLDADVLLRFVGLVMDGAVLQIGAGLTFDVEPMVQLVRAALAPK
jgi:TetR/AcrR family transcriptional regulator, transcriptional repressor of aconitase